MIVAGSGEIHWNSSFLQQSESKNDNRAASADIDVHDIFYRALENLIDKALMQLSIVRFGFQQWIGVEQSPSGGTESTGRTSGMDATLLDEWELPLTPTSPDTSMASDEADVPSGNTSQKGSEEKADSTSPTPRSRHESKETPHVYTLHITIGSSQQGLLLQHNTSRASSLRPIGSTETDLTQGVCATSPNNEQDNDVNRLPPIAAAKVAPYGVSAKVISIPATNLGSVEQEAIDAWASIFGYPVSFLTEGKAQKQSKESSLVWITMAGADEPMLYPRCLVFLDMEETAAMFASTPNELDTHATVSVQNDAKALAAAESEQSLLENSTTGAIQRLPADEHEEKEDGEEGEEGEEGEYDEEGEISDSADTTLPYTAAPASEELDAIVSQLSAQTSRSLEQSFAAIRNTMSLFQAELQAEEEKEKEKRAKEEAAAAAAAAVVSSKEANPPVGSSGTTTSSKAATAPNGARKRQRSSSKSDGPNKARRKSNASAAPAGATETRDSKLDLSNDDVPLQALLAGTADLQPKSEPAALAPAAGLDEGKLDGAPGTDVANNTDADFEALFGDAGIDVGGIGLLENGETRNGDAVADGQGDIGLGFGQMNDDMGLGMGMNMGDSMDGGMGDLTSMFGVTDDDFNFFDSMPPSQQQQQQQPKAEGLAAPLPTVTEESMDVGIKSDLMFEDALGLGETGARDTTSVSAFAARDTEHQSTDVIDDLLDDDGMFDSFFGGTTTTADGGDGSTEVVVALPETSQPADDASVGMVAIGGVDGPASATATAGFEGTINEQPMGIHALSSPPGIASVLSTTETHVGAAETLGSSAMITDLATPASIRATPGQSTDILTPTPTSNPAHLPKGVVVVGDDGNTHSGAVPTPGAPHAQGEDVQLTVSRDGAGTEAATVQRRTDDATVQKAAAQKTRITAMRPKTYSSVNTAFDDVGKDSRSWLRDRPTPAQINDDSIDMQDVMEQGHQRVSLIERSLNPVSWIKRVSARQLQHQAMASRRGSETGTTGVPRSVRQMRSWLASYQARLSYTKDFAPRSVRAARASAADGAAAAAAEEEAILDAAEMQGGPEQAQLQPQHKEGGAGQNLQYPRLDRVRTTERATDTRQPSFISIISPRTTLAQRQRMSSGVQMPGSLAPSLDMDSLQLAASSSAAVHHAERTMVCATALTGSWVPLWLRVAGGAAELLAGQPLAAGLTWDAAFSALAGAARNSLAAAGGSHTYQTEIAPAQMDKADTGGPVAATNLGARIGGLLLGPERRQEVSAFEDDRTFADQHVPDTSLRVCSTGKELGKWISRLREDSDRWTAIVEMLADWAVHGTLLACVQGYEGCEAHYNSSKDQFATALLGSQKLSMAFESFWLDTHGTGRLEEGKRGRPAKDDAEQMDASGTLTLGRLVGLDSSSPAATAKYRGYVVKKRRVAPSSGGS
ncbi:hypothetical protein H4R20_002949, partial [Coemansia guatemalensis]